MRPWVRVVGTALSVMLLSGCLGRGGTPSAVKSPGIALPISQPAMLYISPRDLERPLVIEATLHRNEETSTPDGRLLEKASLAVLRQVFSTVDTNQTAIKPRVVAKVQGQAKFSRRDRLLKISCSLDVYQADGTVIGSYFSRYDGGEPVEYKDAIQPGYQICLTQATNDMLASPAFGRSLQAGFPVSSASAYKSFVESLGLKP